MHKKCIAVVLLLLPALILCAGSYEQETSTETSTKTIAIGDVDAGYSMSGQKAYDVKETIQIALKKELEKIGKGRYVVNITSPAVVTEDAQEEADIPTMPTERVPTQAEMSAYMAKMQKWQKQMSGEVKVHKPVHADAFFEFKVQSGSGGADTGGVASEISRFTGVTTSMADISTSTTKMNLVCDMRDPATGTLLDRYTAKASSVKFRNLAGFTSYDYGSDDTTKERLFENAVKKCAKWIGEKVK